MKNNTNGTNRAISRLTAEKKKTFIALCLIAVMAFMWVRVLGKKKPAVAEASSMPGQAAKAQSNSQLKISFIELPEVKGRNDVLTRDFFAANGWQGFIKDGGNLTGVEEVGANDGSEGVIRRVAEKLKLEAILSGENPQAFINDKLLGIGDSLIIKDGGSVYEFEVVGIEQTEVFIRCGKSKIKLSLTESSI